MMMTIAQSDHAVAMGFVRKMLAQADDEEIGAFTTVYGFTLAMGVLIRRLSPDDEVSREEMVAGITETIRRLANSKSDIWAQVNRPAHKRHVAQV
jgi:hypothetical protein